MPVRSAHQLTWISLRRRRLLVLLAVVSVVLTLTGTAPASAHPGIGMSGENPIAELQDAEQQRRDSDVEAGRLAVEHRRAQGALRDARAELATVVAEREDAEVALEEAEDAIATARAEVETATTRLNATTRQLREFLDDRALEDGKLKVVARESYKEGAAGIVTAAVTFDALVAQDDHNDAMHSIDMLTRLAARRADGVVKLTSLADRLTRIQTERAAQLLQRHTTFVVATDRRDQREQDLEAARRRETDQRSRVDDAEKLVATLADARAANVRSSAELDHLIEDWNAYIPSLRAVSMRASVPPGLARYGNGRIPPSALAPIGVGSHRLWGPAAGAFKALRAAAAEDGISIGVTDSYRTYSSQVSLAGRKGLYSEGGLAARPGSSEHGWGLALDLDLSAAAQRWMRANARAYGFVENTPREPWHWVFTAQPSA